MNSIIEAQITLKEETRKELERCSDLGYVYENYFHVYNEPVVIRDVDWHYLNRMVGLEKSMKHVVTKNLRERI